jgi:hypothetical protein
MELILVDPGIESIRESKPIAQRLSELKGKRIGLLDNIKHNAVYLLDAVGDRLVQDFGCEVHPIKKKTYTRFAEPHVMAALQKYDAVVTAIGD